MKKPPTVLDTLVRISQLKEQRAKERFQRTKQVLLDLEKMLQEITQRPRRMFSELEGSTIDGARLQYFSWGLEMVFEEKGKVERILNNKREELEKLREQALRLYQKRRIAEILFEKAWRYYRQELEHLELKELDDLVLLRRDRNEAG